MDEMLDFMMSVVRDIRTKADETHVALDEFDVERSWRLADRVAWQCVADMVETICNNHGYDYNDIICASLYVDPSIESCTDLLAAYEVCRAWQMNSTGHAWQVVPRSEMAALRG